MPIFELPFTFSPADMPAAFSVAVGSRTDESHPREVQLDAHHHLTDGHGHELHRLSYAIIEVKAIRKHTTDIDKLANTGIANRTEILRLFMLMRWKRI